MSPTNLHLTVCSEEHLAALIAGDETFLQRFGLTPEPGYIEFPEALPYFQGLQQNGELAEPWTSYLVIEDHRKLIGMCGFKSKPNDRKVEFGYGIARAYRGRGIATWATGKLEEISRTSGDVDLLFAHTLPERNASARVLEKCGFEYVGVVEDPDDGPVWRWEKLLNKAVTH